METETVNLPRSSLNYGFDSLVLIFGEDKDTSLMLKTLLEIWHYRVKLIDKWEELEKFGQSEKPVLILVDLYLPFEENLKHLRRVREDNDFFSIPVIILSGHSQASYRETAMNFGINEFLVKPLDFNQLKDCLNEYAGKLI